VEVTLNAGGTTQITADNIFIDTGTRVKIPNLAGLEKIPYLTSTTILELKTVPSKLLILGGGYVGLEYGQMFRRFGSEVTILDSGKQFLKKEDKDVAAALRNILTEEGITIIQQAEALRVEPGQDPEYTLTYKIAETEQTLTFTHLLLATGRSPQSHSLNLEKAGVVVNKKGYIQVNDCLETNIPGIFALGEANGGPAFTHIAYNDYVIVARNLLEQAQLTTRKRPLPYCMFTDPQLGRVGLTEQQAIDQGYTVKVATLPMQRVARALETGETRGLMKAVLDAKTKKILGVAVLGTEGGETAATLQLAMQAGLTYEDLKYTIFAHPTFAESINNLFLNLKE
jgi:pyruvate/2-oxoglutarate dehydrogenase complex dihydrolipoamide dehydrogenase (E3) component